MKKILLITAVAFMFSACSKCVECTVEDSQGSTSQYTTNEYNPNTGNETTTEYGDYIQEICSDNFESKEDFDDYIDYIEDNGGECKGDLFN